MPVRNAGKALEVRQQRRRVPSDLSASVNQSAADKIIGSVSYPFCAFDQTYPFTGRNSPNDHLYSVGDMQSLFQKAANRKSIKFAPPADPEEEFLSAVLNGTSPVIEAAKAYLRACDEADAQGQKITGPDRREIKKMLDSGVAGLGSYRGVQLKAHLAWLKVCVGQKPSVAIGSPRLSIKNLNVEVSATGELWLYHPTPHCSHWCFDWSITWDWTKIAWLTLRDIRIAADAHADTTVDGTRIKVTGVLDRLRLDYPILRDIPLEGIANGELKNKAVYVYDASQLIATVPLLGSRFTVAGVALPNSNGTIEADITVKQI